MKRTHHTVLYDTRTKKPQELKPKRKEVLIYSCGPTLYKPAHIGNMRSYVFADILNRALRRFGYRPRHVINLTDVGHLTDDADAGEDKVEQQAEKENMTAKEVTERMERYFFRDLKRLGIQKNRYRFPRATAYIREQIALIRKIEKRNLAYSVPDGLYFDTGAYAPYGALTAATDTAQSRIRNTEGKKRPEDFALWKRTPEGVKRQQEWDSPWGRGFPGWHIECSAMAMKLLGETIDIHTGGADHIPVHHTNEIAQSESVTGKPFARIWMHNAFMTIEGEKLSKSLNNSYTIDDLEKRGYDPAALRYLFLQTAYRTPLSFSFRALDAAQTALNRLREEYASLRPGFLSLFNRSVPDEYRSRIDAAVADDLNTAKVLAAAWDSLRDGNLSPAQKRNTLRSADNILGILPGAKRMKKEKIPETVTQLLKKRDAARAEKDYHTADTIRDEIHALGYGIVDTEQGSEAVKQ